MLLLEAMATLDINDLNTLLEEGPKSEFGKTRTYLQLADLNTRILLYY